MQQQQQQQKTDKLDFGEIQNSLCIKRHYQWSEKATYGTRDVQIIYLIRD